MPKILIKLRVEIRNPKKLFIVKTSKTIEIERTNNVEINYSQSNHIFLSLICDPIGMERIKSNILLQFVCQTPYVTDSFFIHKKLTVQRGESMVFILILLAFSWAPILISGYLVVR